MKAPNTNVFVSYSHDDSPLVGPVVKLLRANKSLVFLDSDNIPGGSKWRDEIAGALKQAQLVVVFWCGHSSTSNAVCNEWSAAINLGKDVLPLLLDATPLPDQLREYQWIDFRSVVQHPQIGAMASISGGGNYSIGTPRPPRFRSRRISLIPLIAGALVVAGVASALIALEVPQRVLVLAAAVGLGVLALRAIARRGRIRRSWADAAASREPELPSPGASTGPSTQSQPETTATSRLMAEQIELEVFRRARAL